MRRLGLLLIYVPVVAIAVATLAPLVWMVSASFMPAGESSAFPPPFLPQHVTFEHYVRLFTSMNLARYLFNSAFLALSVTAISLLINSP